MNHKNFVVSFTLTVFFFFMYVKKTHGCHPGGYYCNNTWPSRHCGAEFLDATLYPGTLEIKVSSPNTSSPHALGHFSFHDDHGHSYRFLDGPQFVNCQECANHTSCQINPFTFHGTFDPKLTPKKGDWFNVSVAVYWNCTDVVRDWVRCTYEKLHYRGQA
ncbi:hypothetical protein C2G38_2055964 [Gigaspora rosea]|uniref:Chitin-binding type-4 domain-containing protein n=1 Tax=Gigaspora rosea TaxID=44941 RepID=A0A397W844_9GLOM|nr:hypothetical protein C2G38_2055964 [Gigaspora rosea]